MVSNSGEADVLNNTGAIAVLRLNDGYLVICPTAAESRLLNSNLEYYLIRSGISSDRLALDNRLDNSNYQKYDLVFEQERVRLFLADPNPETPGLARLNVGNQRIEYNPPVQLNQKSISSIDDLETLITLVDQDSLVSYVYRLQAYFRRPAGSDSIYACRDWLASKFSDFGFDSIYTDHFQEYISGLTDCYNVVAVKPGSRLPNQQIVIGAHYDGVTSSPAANDNGSGTAGVLELARILKNITTDVTLVFILFDAEEYGLYGSYHYADNAAANGDSIIYMFNMDMIANYENDTEIDIYHGPDVTYADLWIGMADSLVGITGYKVGNISASDHYPFHLQGWPVVFPIEHEFSSVYHTSQDSTTYMSFPYMTKVIKASLATLYYSSQMYLLPQVSFDYPEGIPSTASPNSSTTVTLEVGSLYDGVPQSGSAQIHISKDGSPYQAVSMTEVSTNLYEYDLPVYSCFTTLDFYFSAEEVDNGRFYSNESDGIFHAVYATDEVIAIEDNFETDQGWTTSVSGASSGQWQRGVPVDDDSWDYDPASDGDGSGSCYLTQNTYGNTDVDNGSVSLMSPAFDLSNGGDLEYDYYLYLTDADGSDHLLVEISNNGGLSNWVTIADHITNGDLNWRHYTVTAEDMTTAGVVLSDNMKIRFTANDGGTQSIVEAGVDGVVIRWYDCIEPLTVNGLRILAEGDTLVWVDDQTVNGSLSVARTETSQPLEVYFLDENYQIFQPNPNIFELQTVVSDPGMGSCSMTADWQFTLSGTAIGATGLTVDIIHLQQSFYTSPLIDVTIEKEYICGDANNDELVNVSDAVHIINYIFVQGASAPIPYESGDVNCDTMVNVSDAVWIINFVFSSGKAPCDADGDSIEDC